jgi:hypothetical protein
MTSYEILMTEELLAEIRRDPSRLPPSFRIGEVTTRADARAGEPPSYGCFYVHVEDDDAPAELEGQVVDPTFAAEYDEDGSWVRNRIISRRISTEDASR